MLWLVSSDSRMVVFPLLLFQGWLVGSSEPAGRFDKLKLSGKLDKLPGARAKVTQDVLHNRLGPG